MAELTIHLSEEAHNALLAAADSRGRSVDELVEETLEKAGLFSSRRVAGWPRKARTGSTRSEEAALEDRRLLDRLNKVYAGGPTPVERDFQKRMWRLQRYAYDRSEPEKQLQPLPATPHADPNAA